MRDHNLKIHYVAYAYESHWNPAVGWADILNERYRLVDDAKDADVAVIHFGPHLYEAVLNTYPELPSRYLIGYGIWESNILPEEYQDGLDLVDEVWTPSSYCYNLFAKYHRRVFLVPHVAERKLHCSRAAIKKVRRLIHGQEGQFNYLHITKAEDKRKNTRQLVEVFSRVRKMIPNARLVIKDRYGKRQTPVYPLNRDGVVYLNESLSEQEMNALYRLCDVVVSPHHAEGWGLTLIEAILFGKPVVASAYSGNMDFLDNKNAFLIPCKEKKIRPKDSFFLFNRNMKWGYIESDDLFQKLIEVYEACSDGTAWRQTEAALKRMTAFSKTEVAQIVWKRMQAIESEIMGTQTITASNVKFDRKADTEGKIKIFTWNVHQSYLATLVETGQEFYFPVKADRAEHSAGYAYAGRPNRKMNSHELRLSEIKHQDFDLVLIHTSDQLAYERFRMLSPSQLKLPTVMLFHTLPGPNARLWIDSFKTLPDVCDIVHVTEFNRRAWDAVLKPYLRNHHRIHVISHGVRIDPKIQWSGHIRKAVTVTNFLKSRAQNSGPLHWQHVIRGIPHVLIGANSEELGGIGEIPNKQIPEVLAKYRVYFNPTYRSSLPLAMLEAMSVGVPVVSRATTELPKVIRNGWNGFCFRSPCDLSESIRRLLHDHSLAKKLGENARITIRQRFSRDVFVQKWNRVFETALRDLK